MAAALSLPAVTIELAVNLGDPDPWVAVDPDKFISGSVDSGANTFDGVTMRYEAGHASFMLDNSDGDFDPTNLDGPYVVDGVTMLRPMLGVRARATHGVTTYPLFRGYLDFEDISYEGRDYSEVSFPCSDGVVFLNNFDGVEQTPQGAGEDSGARVNRILDNAGWPATLRDIDTGNTTVVATTLAGNAWNDILLTVDTEIGEAYFKPDGVLRFRSRHALLTEDRSASPQAIFGDRPDELPYASLSIQDSGRQLRNRINIGRAMGTVQTAEDVDSQVRYGPDGVTPMPRVWGRSDLLMQSDGSALGYAQFVLSQCKDAELRFNEMVVDPLTDPDNLFPQVLGRQLADRITGRLRTPIVETLIERDAFIRGIHHTLDTQSWSTRWVLQDATKWAFLVFDHPVLGRFDFNRFAY